MVKCAWQCVDVRALMCVDCLVLLDVRAMRNVVQFFPKLNIWGCTTIIYINIFMYMQSTMSEGNKTQKKT